MKIEMKNRLPIGFGVALGGREFELLGYELHTKRNGEKTTLAIWRTQCAVCDRGFETKCPAHVMPGSRRCADHKQPGVKVPTTTQRLAIAGRTGSK